MFKLVCAFAVLAVTSALFQCPSNYCDNVLCSAPANCENGLIKEGSSFCGCCSTCITQLAEGDSCASNFLLGVPSTTECGEGLECSRSTWKCVQKSRTKRATGPCSTRLAEIEASKANGIPLIGVDEPKCDADGNYGAVQCLGSVCYCVDMAGNEISGYQSSIANLASMNCQCARDLAAYMATGMVGKLFNCDITGNYAQGQAQTLPPVAAVTTQAPMMTTNGQSSFLSNNGVFGQVAAQQDCATALLSSQGSNLLGAFVPNCDADGRYAPRQCQGSECYCVRKDGTKIEGYSSPISLKDRVTCQCARDKDSFSGTGLVGQIHTCRHNGNYQQYQCVGSVCYCTDDIGNKVLEKSAPIGNLGNLVC